MARIYSNFTLAFNEIRRDLKEMGREVKTKTVQALDITNINEYDTMELFSYKYSVENPRFEDLELPNAKWAEAEWQERLSGILGHPVNPGEAYVLRDEKHGDNITWSDHLNSTGTFDYTYSERFAQNDQFKKVLDVLRFDPNTRQAVINMQDVNIDPDFLGGKGRVPCSLNWQLMIREGKIHMIYSMRACEFGTHFQHDIFFSLKILQYFSERVGVPMGSFTHNINSFHCYKRNLQGVY